MCYDANYCKLYSLLMQRIQHTFNTAVLDNGVLYKLKSASSAYFCSTLLLGYLKLVEMTKMLNCIKQGNTFSWSR